MEIVKITLAFSDKNFVDYLRRGPINYISKDPTSKESGLAMFDYLNAEGVVMNILDIEKDHPLFDHAEQVKIQVARYL